MNQQTFRMVSSAAVGCILGIILGAGCNRADSPDRFAIVRVSEGVVVKMNTRSGEAAFASIGERTWKPVAESWMKLEK